MFLFSFAFFTATTELLIFASDTPFCNLQSLFLCIYVHYSFSDIAGQCWKQEGGLGPSSCEVCRGGPRPDDILQLAIKLPNQDETNQPSASTMAWTHKLSVLIIGLTRIGHRHLTNKVDYCHQRRRSGTNRRRIFYPFSRDENQARRIFMFVRRNLI